MWKKRIQTNSATPTFSLKDIDSLVKDELGQHDRRLSRSSKHSVFHRVRISTSVLRLWSSLRQPPSLSLIEKSDTPARLHNADSIIVYFTSLRVVRKTFEDCHAVRSILRGFRVPIDERDLAMDARYLHELQGLSGSDHVVLPRVYIGSQYIGGADEIRVLFETGELKRRIHGLPFVKPGVCENCGGQRFVVCDECRGSRKIYHDERCEFRTCSACNENGLIRCPSCAPPLVSPCLDANA